MNLDPSYELWDWLATYNLGLTIHGCIELCTGSL